MTAIRVTIWHEYRHEKHDKHIAEVYPEGIHGALAEGLAPCGFEIHTATLDEPEHGLTQDVLDNTDVLTWWGHMGIMKSRMRSSTGCRNACSTAWLDRAAFGHLSKVFRA